MHVRSQCVCLVRAATKTPHRCAPTPSTATCSLGAHVETSQTLTLGWMLELMPEVTQAWTLAWTPTLKNVGRRATFQDKNVKLAWSIVRQARRFVCRQDRWRRAPCVAQRVAIATQKTRAMAQTSRALTTSCRRAPSVGRLRTHVMWPKCATARATRVLQTLTSRWAQAAPADSATRPAHAVTRVTPAPRAHPRDSLVALAPSIARVERRRVSRVETSQTAQAAAPPTRAAGGAVAALRTRATKPEHVREA